MAPGDHGQPRPARARRGARPPASAAPIPRSPASSPGSRSCPTTAPTCPGARSPTLVLQCRNDVIAPVAVGEYVRDALPTPRYVVLDATGHCPNLRAPDATAAAIDDVRAGVTRALTGSTPPCSTTTPSSTSGRRAATCRPRPTARSSRSTRRSSTWTGYARDDLVGRRTFADLLTGGGRIYHETHYAPMLQMQGTAREIALDIVVRRRAPPAGAGQLGARARRSTATPTRDPHARSSTPPSAASTSGSCCAPRSGPRSPRRTPRCSPGRCSRR